MMNMFLHDIKQRRDLVGDTLRRPAVGSDDHDVLSAVAAICRFADMGAMRAMIAGDDLRGIPPCASCDYAFIHDQRTMDTVRGMA